MNVRLIDNASDIGSEKYIWESIYEDNTRYTPFQSYVWNASWAKNILSDQSTLFLVVENDENQPIGFAPFCIERKYKALPLKHVFFISDQRADYLDFIIQEGKEQLFFQTLFAYFKDKKDWDQITLGDLRRISPNYSCLLENLWSSFQFLNIENTEICLSIHLPDTWEDFVQSLGSRTRRDVRYDRRYLAKHFDFQFKVFEKPADMEAGFIDLTSVFKSRWEEEKGTTRYESESLFNFEYEVCQDFSQKGNYRIFILYLNEKPEAVFSGFIKEDVLYGDVFAHNHEFRKYSIGNVLLGYCVEYCIGKNFKIFDLSRGQENYKYKWKGVESVNQHIKIYRNRRVMFKSQVIDYLYDYLKHHKLFHGLYFALYRFRNKIGRFLAKSN